MEINTPSTDKASSTNTKFAGGMEIKMDKKDAVKKYMMLYMGLGMCFGVSIGLVFGKILYPDNMSMGICFGLPIGMYIGMTIGTAKDKRLTENIMKICRIEAISGSSDTMIYSLDKNGTEKEYRVTEKKMKAEKFVVNDRVAEETDGSLVSLESK